MAKFLKKNSENSKMYFIMCDLVSAYDMNISAMIRLLDSVRDCRLNRLCSLSSKVQKIRWESLKIQHENRTNGIIRKANDIICFLRDLFTVFQGEASLNSSDSDESDEGGNAGNPTNKVDKADKTPKDGATNQKQNPTSSKPKLVMEVERKKKI